MDIMTVLKVVGGIFAALLVVGYFPTLMFGLVRIQESEVGIVIKKFAKKSLQAGHLIALDGEAGYQADTLAPGWHFGYFPWMYSVEKHHLTTISPGEIGLIVANDGDSMAPNQMLGKTVKCEDYQDARSFLKTGGQKGRQISILTAGTYRINTALFNVITSANAEKNGMPPNKLLVTRIESEKVGVVTTLDGAPIKSGEIAGNVVDGHNSFQDAQSFMDNGGQRGLQIQTLLSGSWNLNPWFAQVQQVPMTEIEIGHVGVVISFVGAEHKDISGDDFKHGDLVDEGHKGVWQNALQPGKHALNPNTLKVVIVPTTNIVLNWANRTESHKYDEHLSSVTVRSKDGFSFTLDVSQIIHVAAKDAPKVISRVGSMQNLVDQVLEPTIGNYFRNSAQDHTVLDFLNDRTGRQKAAKESIQEALKEYNVQAVDTLIGDISAPDLLMQVQTDRKIAEEQKKTYEVQEAAQKQRQELVRATSLAEIQKQMVDSEQGVKIAELNASMAVKRSEGEAKSIELKAKAEGEAIKQIGSAKAEAYVAGVKAMGESGFTALQITQAIGEKNIKVTPDFLVNGGGSDGAGSGLMQALLATVLAEKNKKVDTKPEEKKTS
jgi:uncharacterized membrane protein YqiK